MVDALYANTDFFAPKSLLVPCLELSVQKPGSPQWPAHLWERCTSFYLSRSAQPPEPPKDWAQQNKIAGASKNPLLRELEEFARDPVEVEHRFRVRMELRHLLHRAIEDAHLDMTHKTERKGSPHTLVCRKTRATYESALRLYESDCRDMRRLLALAEDCCPRQNELADQLRTALAKT